VRLATAVDANGLTIFLMATVWLEMQSLAELGIVSHSFWRYDFLSSTYQMTPEAPNPRASRWEYLLVVSKFVPRISLFTKEAIIDHKVN
jgi:hypothetical protein